MKVFILTDVHKYSIHEAVLKHSEIESYLINFSQFTGGKIEVVNIMKLVSLMTINDDFKSFLTIEMLKCDYVFCVDIERDVKFNEMISKHKVIPIDIKYSTIINEMIK